jgi:hypothetical protein
MSSADQLTEPALAARFERHRAEPAVRTGSARYAPRIAGHDVGAAGDRHIVPPSYP